MEINDSTRKLIQIEDDDFWESLPKDIRALPVYYRRTKTGIDLWPMWVECMINPTIRVFP